ncbi:MAG: flagellar protein FlgN [Spirochaetes bacterium]|nr:flagellar protein FlgN [Spirochaetota bacterium]
MDRLIVDMCEILDAEAKCLGSLCELEENKTDVIMVHDGKNLERISRDQESILERMRSLETRRMARMQAIRGRRGISGDITTLADMIARLEGDAAACLKERRARVRNAAGKLGRIREKNHALIRDNMEYYEILLTGLRRESARERGYGCDGREEDGLRNSILFNQTA